MADTNGLAPSKDLHKQLNLVWSLHHTTSPGVLVLTTLNLVVYASLWMVQAHHASSRDMHLIQLLGKNILNAAVSL